VNVCEAERTTTNAERWVPALYRDIKFSPLVPILNQIYPVHITANYFRDIQFNVILLSTPRSFKVYVPFWISDETLIRICHLSSVCCMLRWSRYPSCHDGNSIWRVKLMKFLIMQLLQPLVTCFVWRQSIIPSASISDTCSTLNFLWGRKPSFTLVQSNT
jgi:hypothetical protein